jgi:hypothetical protein
MGPVAELDRSRGALRIGVVQSVLRRFFYERRRPEETTLYQVVQEEFETSLAQVEAKTEPRRPCAPLRTGPALHTGVRCGAHLRKELERLCRYITRPAIANERQLWNRPSATGWFPPIDRTSQTGHEHTLASKESCRAERPVHPCGFNRSMQRIG